MSVVARAASAIAVSGSPSTAPGYQSAAKPSACARSACLTTWSVLVPKPVSPMRIDGPVRSVRWCGALPGGRSGLAAHAAHLVDVDRVAEDRVVRVPVRDRHDARLDQLHALVVAEDLLGGAGVVGPPAVVLVALQRGQVGVAG